MIFNFVYINAPSDLLRYPECNQISILGNRTPVREIDAQTEKKNHGITRPRRDSCPNEVSEWMPRHGRY